MKILGWLLGFWALATTISAASLAVLNDGPFPLHVQVLAADGRLLGSITIEPEQQKSWNDPNLTMGNTPTTPYTVIFYCLEGDEYGITNNVAGGSTISSSTAEGRRVCKPQTKSTIKQEQQERQQNPSLQDHNVEQWSTDQIN